MLWEQVILCCLENNEKEEGLSMFSRCFLSGYLLTSSWLITWIRNYEYECLTVLHKQEVQNVYNYKFSRLRWLSISHFIRFILFHPAASFSKSSVVFPIWKITLVSAFQVCYCDRTAYLLFLGISSPVGETGASFHIYQKSFQEYLSLC